MKKIALVLALLVTFTAAFAVEPKSPPPPDHPCPPPHHLPPPPPVMCVLDTDGDGQLSAAEIANASNALLELDTNGDGVLTSDELRPPPPSLDTDNQPAEMPPPKP